MLGRELRASPCLVPAEKSPVVPQLVAAEKNPVALRLVAWQKIPVAPQLVPAEKIPAQSPARRPDKPGRPAKTPAASADQRRLRERLDPKIRAEPQQRQAQAKSLHRVVRLVKN